MRTDEELAAAVATGNEAALGELIARYEHGLGAFLWRQTSGRDSEDLFQETWLRVVRSADRFDPTRKFSTWLFQIAVNLARDWHRRRPPEPTAELPEPSHAGSAARVEAGADAERLLDRLSTEHREVVVLGYYHDLPNAEVARILGIPEGTVKSRMHHALAKLSRIVRDAGGAHG